jgi:hypothetical protein
MIWAFVADSGSTMVQQFQKLIDLVTLTGWFARPCFRSSEPTVDKMKATHRTAPRNRDDPTSSAVSAPAAGPDRSLKRGSAHSQCHGCVLLPGRLGANLQTSRKCITANAASAANWR